MSISDCSWTLSLRGQRAGSRCHGWPVTLRVLDGPVARSLPQPEPEELAIVRAWVYLQAGDPSGGLAMMRTALHADQLDADFQPLSTKDEDDEDGFELWQAPELALALHAAHDDASARKLCLGAGRDACESAARRSPGDVVPDGPWQARHARERADLARAMVGAAAASAPL